MIRCKIGLQVNFFGLKVKKMDIKVNINILELMQELFDDALCDAEYDECLGVNATFSDDIGAVIKDKIVREAVSEVMTKCGDKISQSLSDIVNDIAVKRIDQMVVDTVEGFINDESFVMRRHGGSELPVKEYLSGIFSTNTGWNCPESTMKKVANEFGENLKSQYDLFFANQLVGKLKDQGFLREDLEKFLLSDKSKG